MWPLKKKKGIPKTDSLADPIDRVKTLSSQGISEIEIIRKMEEEGYTPAEIDNSMKDALKSRVDSQSSREFLPPRERFASGGPAPPRAPEMTPEPIEPALRPEPVEPAPAPAPMPPEPIEERPPAPVAPAHPAPTETELALPPGPPPSPRTGAGAPQPPFTFEEFGNMQRPAGAREPEKLGPGVYESEFDEEEDMPASELEGTRRSKESRIRETEEIVEAIVEEKWGMMKGELADIHGTIEGIDSRIGSLEQTMEQIRGEKKTEIKQIDEKIDTYKESISEMCGRMEAMETAIKNSLTPMMQSLRSLSETVKTIKKK